MILFFSKCSMALALASALLSGGVSIRNINLIASP
jgi:hypothetical protein